MRGEKTVDLGFTFTVGQGDKGYVDVSTVTVRAPGFRRADIHDTMVAWVSKASINFAKVRAGLPSDAESTVEDEEAIRALDDDDQDWMQMVAMGLEVDQYATFASYVRKVLTNSKLASVGDDGKLTDEAWEAIYEQGGMEAVRRIESAFVGFFFESLLSTGRRGNGKSRSSASPSRARSTSKKPATTPG